MTNTMNNPVRVPVALGGRSYDIMVGHGLLANAAALIAPHLRSPRTVLIADAAVAKLYGEPLRASLLSHGMACELIIVPSGEATKSFNAFETLLNTILALGIDRKTTLIALGGGVVGDVVGFAASVLLRGIDFIQIPTTLLAQVDSSVGGKTAINSVHGKNLVGSFYQPRLVLADLATLDSLPPRERAAGYGEVLKYGLIMNAEFYQWCLRHGADIVALQPEYTQRAVAASCSMKADIVARDEQENDVRAWLNFGHTFAHALEAETGFGSALLHGEAVAIGMRMACRLSHQLGYIGAQVEEQLKQHLQAVGLPADVSMLPGLTVERLMPHFARDKKSENGALNFVVLQAVGQAVVQKNIAPEFIAQLLQTMLEESYG
jgi:3-dehydroquinate synthase